MKKLLKNQKGFTLIELIIVIAILAVIAGIAIPNLINNINQSRITADVSNGKSIANIVAKVIAENPSISLATAPAEFDVNAAGTATALDGLTHSQIQGEPRPKFQVSGTTATFRVSVSTAGAITVKADINGDGTSDHTVFPVPDSAFYK